MFSAKTSDQFDYQWNWKIVFRKIRILCATTERLDYVQFGESNQERNCCEKTCKDIHVVQCKIVRSAQFSSETANLFFFQPIACMHNRAERKKERRGTFFPAIVRGYCGKKGQRQLSAIPAGKSSELFSEKRRAIWKK